MTLRFPQWARRLAGAIVLVAFLAGARAGPVEFRFAPAPRPGAPNPFAREVWGQVITPSHRALLLPAYYDGNDTYVVHARPDEIGTFRLAAVLESIDGKNMPLTARSVSPVGIVVGTRTSLPAIRRDSAVPDRFVDANGARFVPVGANVAWAEGDAVPFYRDAFARFGNAGLNWMRIWMAHWGGLNLDWTTRAHGPTPHLGTLAPAVAEKWDALVDAAERHRVYIQLVLQHHGQYSTRTNSNWAENPWNAANKGGFLKSPEDFFTSSTARQLTKSKYRYIVARWGWSPAIFAWELFNEVHWVDAMATPEGEAKVGAWHSEMADFLRSIDVYQHLVTTSTENLASPCYAKMDFYQPHLYPADLILGARRVIFPHGVADRPVFYGEEGDDHLNVSDAIKHAGTAIVPAAWAGIFGETRMPAQPWLGATILKQNRTDELGAVQRFLHGSGLLTQPDLAPFSPVVASAARVSFELVGSQEWQRWAPPDLVVPLDGTIPIGFADVPRFYVASGHASSFPSLGTYHFDLPRDTTLCAHVVGVGNGPAQIEFLVDGRSVALVQWTKADARPSAAHPRDIRFPVAAGQHTLVVKNEGNGASVEISGIDFGIEVSQIAAIGLRDATYFAVWMWNRPDVYAASPRAVTGTLVLNEVPAGEWHVTWWDTETGRAAAPRTVHHNGGPLRLSTPSIGRHAAVVISK